MQKEIRSGAKGGNCVRHRYWWPRNDDGVRPHKDGYQTIHFSICTAINGLNKRLTQDAGGKWNHCWLRWRESWGERVYGDSTSGKLRGKNGILLCILLSSSPLKTHFLFLLSNFPQGMAFLYSVSKESLQWLALHPHFGWGTFHSLPSATQNSFGVN